MLHIIFPALSSWIYLKISKKCFQGISPRFIKYFSIIHNSVLHLFSSYVFCNLLLTIYLNGITAGRQFYFQIEQVDKIVFLFYLSKYYEYIDTFLIYAKKKEPIFLQKFHHLGAVFIWHLSYVYKFDGIVFASMLNSGVHSFMYLYYLLSIIKTNYIDINKLKQYKIYLTSLQITQLGYGFYALPYFYYKLETTQNKIIIWVCDIYIFILIVLFVQFMVKSYFSRKSDKEKYIV
jgi:hypothetical protein